jgi:hypothetical protein
MSFTVSSHTPISGVVVWTEDWEKTGEKQQLIYNVSNKRMDMNICLTGLEDR